MRLGVDDLTIVYGHAILSNHCAPTNYCNGISFMGRMVDDLIFSSLQGDSARRPRLTHNCRNCGAPPEPACSYCKTEAAED